MFYESSPSWLIQTLCFWGSQSKTWLPWEMNEKFSCSWDKCITSWLLWEIGSLFPCLWRRGRIHSWAQDLHSAELVTALKGWTLFLPHLDPRQGSFSWGTETGQWEKPPNPKAQVEGLRQAHLILYQRPRHSVNPQRGPRRIGRDPSLWPRFLRVAGNGEWSGNPGKTF